MDSAALAYRIDRTPAAAAFYLQAQQQSFNNNLFDRFIEYTDRKDSTIKGYLTCIRQFMLWLNDEKIQQPCRDDIKAYREYLERRQLAIGTQQQYLRAVKHFFKWTASEGLYPNIADNIHSAKVRHDLHKKDALSREDVPKIAESIDRSDEQGKRLYAMYLLCITCGLRCVEIHRANIEDLKTVGSRSYLYIQGKGHDDKDAPVLITPEVLAALKEYLAARTGDKSGKAPLFTGTSNRSKGQRIAETTISTMLKNMLINAGYDSDRLTAHSLRHTSGTGAYLATGNIYLAQKHQRHCDPATTEIYIHAEEREHRNTEQQVYNYYFNGDAAEDKQQIALDLVQQLPPDKLDKVIDFIKAIR